VRFVLETTETVLDAKEMPRSVRKAGAVPVPVQAQR
jgi:hypothetical protein